MRTQLLFDTSVWVDFLNKKDIPQALLLEEYIETDSEVLLTPHYTSGNSSGNS